MCTCDPQTVCADDPLTGLTARRTCSIGGQSGASLRGFWECACLTWRKACPLKFTTIQSGAGWLPEISCHQLSEKTSWSPGVDCAGDGYWRSCLLKTSSNLGHTLPPMHLRIASCMPKVIKFKESCVEAGICAWYWSCKTSWWDINCVLKYGVCKYKHGGSWWLMKRLRSNQQQMWLAKGYSGQAEHPYDLRCICCLDWLHIGVGTGRGTKQTHNYCGGGPGDAGPYICIYIYIWINGNSQECFLLCGNLLFCEIFVCACSTFLDIAAQVFEFPAAGEDNESSGAAIAAREPKIVWLFSNENLCNQSVDVRPTDMMCFIWYICVRTHTFSCTIQIDFVELQLVYGWCCDNVLYLHELIEWISWWFSWTRSFENPSCTKLLHFKRKESSLHTAMVRGNRSYIRRYQSKQEMHDCLHHENVAWSSTYTQNYGLQQ